MTFYFNRRYNWQDIKSLTREHRVHNTQLNNEYFFVQKAFCPTHRTTKYGISAVLIGRHERPFQGTAGYGYNIISCPQAHAALSAIKWKLFWWLFIDCVLAARSDKRPRMYPRSPIYYFSDITDWHVFIPRKSNIRPWLILSRIVFVWISFGLII